MGVLPYCSWRLDELASIVEIPKIELIEEEHPIRGGRGEEQRRKKEEIREVRFQLIGQFLLEFFSHTTISDAGALAVTRNLS